MNAMQLLKPLLLLSLLSGGLLANDDEPQSKCEKKYDKCIEKCDDKGSTEECYNKCDEKNDKCVAAEEEK